MKTTVLEMKHLTIFILGLLLIGCNSNQQESANHSTIHLSENVMEVAKLPLSDAVQKVDIVPLETTDESLLNDLGFVEVTDNSIFIYQRRTSEILRFSRDGKFLNKIGKQGQGPGEYTYISGLQIDENKGEVYAIAVANGVLVYDLEGTFKRQVIEYTSLEKHFSSITNKQYLLFDDQFFFTQTLPFFKPVKEDSIWSVTIADKQFQINKTFCSPSYRGRIEGINENLTSDYSKNYWKEEPISIDTYQNELTLKYPDTDTIYVYDQAGQQLNPQYTIFSNEPKGDYGKTHLWMKERSAFDYFSIRSYYPSKDFIYLIGSKGDEIYTYAFNRADGTVKLCKRQSEITERKMPWNATFRRMERPFILSNDICGGEFNIRFRSQGKYWIDVQAQNYEDYMVDIDKISASKVKDEQNKQALLDTFNKLNEDSNPVLLIATLK